MKCQRCNGTGKLDNTPAEVQEVFDYYMNFPDRCPKKITLTDARRKKIEAALAKHEVGFIKEAIRKAHHTREWKWAEIVKERGFSTIFMSVGRLEEFEAMVVPDKNQIDISQYL